MNNNKNIIAIVSLLHRAHQIDMKVREPLLGDEDVQRLGPGMVMNLALLAVQRSWPRLQHPWQGHARHI